MYKHISLLTLACFTLLFFGCTKTETSTPKTNVQLTFTHEFAGQTLELNKTYTTLLSDQVNFTTFNYYVSNIQLKKADGTTWTETESYHLLKVDAQNQGKITLTLTDVPQGQYTEASFSIGIDALRNSSGAQEGDLDPVNGMFWTWKTGYMFVKSEGFYYKNGQKMGAFVYHTGDNAAFQTVTLALNNTDLNAANSQLGVKADVQKMFGGFSGDAIQLNAPADGSSVTIKGGDNAVLISKNYSQMFSFDEAQK